MRSTKSTTSSSEKALSSESIGTAWRTLAKRAGRRRADLQRQAFQRAQIGKALLDRVVALAQRIVFGVRDGRPVVLVVALVVLRRSPPCSRACSALACFAVSSETGTLLGFLTAMFPSWPGLSRPSTSFRLKSKDVDARHKAGHDDCGYLAALISRSAAARASSVISAPASMRAISSRRRSAATSVTRVATRLPLSSASLVMR